MLYKLHVLSTDSCSADGVNCTEWSVFMEPRCDSLFMCMITVTRDGVKSGGGISDVIRRPPSYVSAPFMGVASNNCCIFV